MRAGKRMKITALFLSMAVSLMTGKDLVMAQESTETEAGQNSDDTIAEVTGGRIQGSFEDGIYTYLGVPYAQANELFRPADEVTPWDGVRDATSYGPISYQSGMFGSAPSEAGANESNNAQNLNIWTPGMDEEKRPVMVWLHGGGFSTGSDNEALYDGTNLSKSQNVVVVGVNHRLGVYGFLDLSAYGDDYRYSGNVGVYDLVDALEWVHENIEKFGGDPDNVTIFGQSGGGAKVLALMSTPYANGLFRRGIVESGATETMGVVFTEKEVSQSIGSKVIDKLGIDPDHIDEIQNVSYADLMSASAEAEQETAEEYQIPQSFGSGYAYEWEPVVDGDFILQQPVQDDGFTDNVKEYPLLIGSNLNEWNTWMAEYLQHDVNDEINAAYAEAYPNEDPDGAADVDMLLRLPLLKITAHKADQYADDGGAPVYSYIFTKQPDGSGSVNHGDEIAYVFDNTDDPLAAEISGFWASFARDGVPSGEGLEEWEPYTRESGSVMILDDETYLSHHHDEKLISLLAPDYEW